MGDNMVGIIHPCKIYGAMAVQRPILYFGPSPSHISDLLEAHDVGWHVNHGDVEAGKRAVEQILAMPVEQLRAMGSHAKVVLHQSLSQRGLCEKLVDKLEEVFRLRGSSNR
jgi:hypothetical protein